MMAKLVLVLGIVFLALGLALGGFMFVSPGQAQILALTPGVSAIFLVGGGLCLGLSAIASAITAGVRAMANQLLPPAVIQPVPQREQPAAAPVDTSYVNRRGTGEPRRSEAALAAGAAAAVLASRSKEAGLSPSVASPSLASPTVIPETTVAETISALEQAKHDIAAALGIDPPRGKPEVTRLEADKRIELGTDEAGRFTETVTETVKETVALAPETGEQIEEEFVAEAEAVAESDEIELYVIEEKVIRGRPARVLSDGTVEAETDEGWMRFENLEHLDEYLEAMVPDA